MPSSDDPGSECSAPEREGDLASAGEDWLVGRIAELASARSGRVIVGIGDDAALLSLSDRSAVTSDLLVEDIHFRLDICPPKLLGRKAMAVNLSDLAAMSAVPLFAILGIAAPEHTPVAFLDDIVAGFVEAGHEHGAELVGGDLCRAGKLMLSVTLFGDAPFPGPTLRSGARPGDTIWVTGSLGDSSLGLELLLSLGSLSSVDDIEDRPTRELVSRHLDPAPRLGFGSRLAGLAGSMMDLSDGIAQDLPRLLARSGGLGAEVDAAALPLSVALEKTLSDGKGQAEAWRYALCGGEDYELLFTARAKRERRVRAAAQDAGVRVTPVGSVTEGPGIAFKGLGEDEARSAIPLYSHFGSGKKP